MQRRAITRRAVLRRLASAGAAVGGAAALPRAMPARAAKANELSVTVLLNEPVATIKPTLYSRFTEHIGGVIYDGIWVGADSKVANNLHSLFLADGDRFVATPNFHVYTLPLRVATGFDQPARHLRLSRPASLARHGCEVRARAHELRFSASLRHLRHIQSCWA